MPSYMQMKGCEVNPELNAPVKLMARRSKVRRNDDAIKYRSLYQNKNGGIHKHQNKITDNVCKN